MNKNINQITNSIYTNLRALDIWVGNLVKVTKNSAYHKKFKNRKCYSCGLYGHASKDCGHTCIYCHCVHNNNICFKQFIHMANKIGSIFLHSGVEKFLENLPKFNFINFNKKSYEKIKNDYGDYLKNYKEKQQQKLLNKTKRNEEEYKDDVNKFYLQNPPQKLENNPIYGLLTMIKFACPKNNGEDKNNNKNKEDKEEEHTFKEEENKNTFKKEEEKNTFKCYKREKGVKKKKTTQNTKNNKNNNKKTTNNKNKKENNKKEYNYEKEINIILNKIKKKNIKSRKIKENIFADIYKDFYNNKINAENIKNGIAIQSKIDHIKNTLKYKEIELKNKVDKIIDCGVKYDRIKQRYETLQLSYDNFKNIDKEIKEEIKEKQFELNNNKKIMQRIKKLEAIIEKKNRKISDIQTTIDVDYSFLNDYQTKERDRRNRLIKLMNQIQEEVEDLQEEIENLYRSFN